MKKLALISLIGIAAMSLTACTKSLSKEKFAPVLDDVTAKIASECTNVHINNRLSVTTYNYKEGEFYSFKTFFAVILITTDQYDHVWSQDGEYYHATRSKINGVGSESCDKITKEQFDSLLAAGKAKVQEELMKPVDSAKAMMSEVVEGYTSIKNSYEYNSMDKIYKMTSKTTYEAASSKDPEQKVQAEKTFIYSFKNSLPTSFKTKDKKEGKTSTEEWKYSYGKAEFTRPDVCPAA